MSGNSSNWPIPVTGYDSLRMVTKRVDRQARSAAPISAADLLGPGMSSQAIHILDWNDEVATFNGFFYTTAGGLNAPVIFDEDEDPLDLPWIGTAIAREDGTGTHQVWNTDDPSSMYFRVRNWAPNPVDPDGPPIYGDWQRFATRSGFIEEEDLHPDVRDEIDLALETAEDALGLILPVNWVFYQPTEPVSDVDHTLVLGDFWFDTDDDNRMWTYDGSDWVDPADAIIAGGANGAQAAAYAAQQALGVADDALAAAVAKIEVFRQTTAPSPGPFPTNSIWYDTDNGNKSAFWSGSSWVDGTTAWLQTNLATSFPNMILSPSGLAAYDASGTLVSSLSSTTGLFQTTGGIFTAGEVNGAVVTGGTVQTVTTAARGLKATSTALVAYSGGAGAIAAGTATFSILFSTGDVTLLGNLTSGSTVTGAVVTGGTLQTSASAATGVKITSTGLVAYGSGVAQTTISASTGAITTQGPVISGGSVTGSSITASTTGVIQTESTASRGIKMNSAGFTAYDGGGSPTFVITASTGAVVMKGDLQSGSTITGTTITGSSFETSTGGGFGKVIIAAGVVNFGTNGQIYESGGFDILQGSGTALGVGASEVRTTVAGSTKFSVTSTGVTVTGAHAVTGSVTATGNLNAGINVVATGSVTAGTGVHGQNVFVDGVPSTANAANCRMAPGDGQLLLSTSAARFKDNIRDFEVDTDAVLAVRLRQWESNIPHERGTHGVGVVADEVHELGLTEFVEYLTGEGGEPVVQGFHYDRFAAVGLLAVVQRQAAQIEDLTARLTTAGL